MKRNPTPVYAVVYVARWLLLGAVLGSACTSPKSVASPSGDIGGTQDAPMLFEIMIGGGDTGHEANSGDVLTTLEDGETAEDSGDQLDVTGAVADTIWPDDLGSGLPFDVAQPDVPYTALQVQSTTPTIDAIAPQLNAAFAITFSRPINPQSIADYTVLVIGPDGQTIPGNFKTQGAVLSFAATTKLAPASRIRVTVTIQVQDFKAQTLDEAYTFHFYTTGYAKTQPYAELAARYAPTIRQGLGSTAPSNDLLRALNFDGDWKADNNATNLSKFDAMAEVTWAVAETQSHFYIHYIFTWPRRIKAPGQAGFNNDSAGATVTVRRYPSETPIALETWFKRSSDERRWLWVTAESGLVPAGKKPGALNVRAVLPLATLFPKAADTLGCGGISGCTPRRFSAYLTGGSHQSCLWSDLGDKVNNVCATDAYHKNKMRLIRYDPGLKATSAQAVGATVKGAKPGTTLPTFTYGLTPLFDTWFPRRSSPDLFVKPLSFVYQPPAGRPKGKKTALGSKLLGGGSDFGRPPWAWRWKPGNNTSYYDLPRGTVFFDPAYALWQRLGGTTAGLASFVPKTKQGMSLAYCFAPFLFIDQRTITACKGSLPAPPKP